VNETLVIQYVMNGEYDRALRMGQTAIEKGIASWKLFVFTGKACYMQKDYKRALALYKKAAVIAPANKVSTVYLEQGITERILGKYRESEADLSMAIRSDSIRKAAITSSMFYERGLTYKQAGNYAMAATDFGEAIRLDSSKLESIIKEKAFAELMSQQWPAAIQDYTTMLNLGITRDAAYNNRGGARFKAGDTAGAIQDFRAALGVNPNYTDAKNNLLRAGVAVH
jgi:tetratricopeptide (TPR) repeat protein